MSTRLETILPTLEADILRSVQVQIFKMTEEVIGLHLRGFKSWVEKVALSKEGKLILSSHLDRTVRLWDVSEKHQ